MIDHIGISVRDYAVSKAFYEMALAPLGVTVLMQFGSVAGFGRDGKPSFWIGAATPQSGGASPPAGHAPLHVAFSAPDRKTVDAFYRQALAAGGVDNGAPGVRAQYHPNYYGAFLLDPDGNNIEAVCHTPE